MIRSAITLLLSSALLLALPTVAAAAEVPPESQQIQREIEDLQALAAALLPSHSTLPALFEIDVTDAAAVARRIEELQARVARDGGDTPTAETLPGVASDAALKLQRDKLRLSFLQLPADVRARLIEDDRQRRERDALAEQTAQAAKAMEAAEQQRNAALQSARDAASAAERVLATEEARLQSVRTELVAQEQAWIARNKAELEQRSALLARYQDAGNPDLTPEQADVLYRSIRLDLRELRTNADQTLGLLRAPSRVPVPGVPLDLSAAALAGHAEARERVMRLRVELSGEVARLRQQEAAERYRDAQDVMRSLKQLQAQRIALRARLSPIRRDEVSGLTPEGLTRVRSELAHLALMARWYPEERRHQFEELPTLLRNVFAAGRISLNALGLLALLFAYGYALRHYSRALGWLRSRILPRVTQRAMAVRISRGFVAFNAIADEVLLLLLVYLIFDELLANVAVSPELDTLRRLAYAVAWYRLVLATVHRLLLSAVQRYRRVEPKLNDKMHASVRLVARFALGLVIYLILSKALLGRGALYEIAVNIGWAGTALVAYRLIRAWRPEVLGSYLSLYPDGWLAGMVRSSENRLHGLPVTVMAFAFVAMRGVLTWLRDLALGFEQIRKALAYLLRRRLERQAERGAGAAPSPHLLPPELTAALSEEAAAGNLRMDRFPQQDEVVLTLQQMSGGGRGGLIALVGDRGAGKTTWLEALRERCPAQIEARLLTLVERELDVAAFLRQLAQLLDAPHARDEAAIVAAACASRPRLVMVDLTQNLMLRAVGGVSCYELLLRVARATSQRVAWVVACSRWPFEFMQRLHPGQDVFDKVIQLGGWSEREISDLIELRMQAAGYTADYSELQLDSAPAPRTRLDHGADITAEIERPSDQYHRIVWDYADGNPRVALHFWRYSLAPDGERRVKVRLFAAPPAALLENTGLVTRFLLAALVQHENLNAAEAARSLRLSEGNCAAMLAALTAQGVLVDQGGRCRVDSHWNRAVLRFLQRKKLLVV